MHPNSFLKSHWRTELRPVVFVAMSFDVRFKRRFEEVIGPAVEALTVDGLKWTAVRVDTTQSGDSILTQIIDHIAHCRFIIADISVVGRDSVTGAPYRNANVLYEVGMALASRQPSEILLVKDDREPSLFDVSTVPYCFIDFTDETVARATLTDQIASRLQNVRYFDDARLSLALASLSSHEASFLLHRWKSGDPANVFALERRELLQSAMIARVLDKGFIRTVSVIHESLQSVYEWTPLGRAAVEKLMANDGIRF